MNICKRPDEVTYLYLKRQEKSLYTAIQTECNVNSYNKDTVAFCKCENAVSWLDKTANITRLRHINLHKCWLLAGFLFGNMILWVGIWLEPIWVSRTWLSTNDQPSPLSTFSFSKQNLAKLTPALSCSCWFLSLCVRLLHREFQRSRHP